MVMFFGLQNSPTTFQAMMNDLLRDLILKWKVVVYMDDILIFSQMEKEHEETTMEVLRRLEENDLFLKPQKCFFNKTKIEYLGFIVTPRHIEMDQSKIEDVVNWDQPTMVKGIQGLLGTVNFYRQFIEGFAEIVKLLIDMTKKGKKFEWTTEAEESFQKLKKAMTTTPVLRLLDPDRPYRVITNTSDYTYAGILEQQDNDTRWHPVVFLSKKMTPMEENYDIHDKELLAIIRATEFWRHLLEGARHLFEIWTDHKNLLYFAQA